MWYSPESMSTRLLSQAQAKAAELKGGYLYLFWQGKLWRELAINDRGYYQDIDVEYYRFLEQEEQQKETPTVIKREASGFVMSQFWAPYKIAGQLQQGENGLKIVFSPKQKRFSQIEALEADAALLAQVSTPLDELSSYSDGQSFSAQAFTSDVESALVHSVSEDDMPWLSDKAAIVRGFDHSNTVIAYVDGHNNGIRLTVETGLTDATTPITHYAVLSDRESDWVLSEKLEYSDENPHFASAQLGGLPAQGIFTLQITSPGHAHHPELVFSELSYEQVMQWATPTQAAPAIEPKPELTAQAQSAISYRDQFMALWQQELGLTHHE